MASMLAVLWEAKGRVTLVSLLLLLHGLRAFDDVVWFNNDTQRT